MSSTTTSCWTPVTAEPPSLFFIAQGSSSCSRATSSHRRIRISLRRQQTGCAPRRASFALDAGGGQDRGIFRSGGTQGSLSPASWSPVRRGLFNQAGLPDLLRSTANPAWRGNHRWTNIRTEPVSGADHWMLSNCYQQQTSAPVGSCTGPRSVWIPERVSGHG